MSKPSGQIGGIKEGALLDEQDGTMFSLGFPASTLHALQVAESLSRAPGQEGGVVDEILECIGDEFNPAFSGGVDCLVEDERASLNEVCPEGDDMKFSQRLTILDNFYGS